MSGCFPGTSKGLLRLSLVKIGFGFRHGPGGDGTHAASIRAIKGKKIFAPKGFSEAEETGVLGHRPTARKDAKAERILKTFVHLGRGDFRSGVKGPVEFHGDRVGFLI